MGAAPGPYGPAERISCQSAIGEGRARGAAAEGWGGRTEPSGSARPFAAYSCLMTQTLISGRTSACSLMGTL